MPESLPLVSVIIPCYNAERFVESAVRSIMEQTYTNLEILCCDDCSTDNTLEILERLAKEDSRIKIVHNETNLKLIATLNKLVAAATGKYIARMDADDISLPNRIEKQLSFLENDPDIGFCGCNAFHINEHNKIIGKSNVPESYDDVKFFLPYFCAIYHPTVFARAEVMKENPYDKEFLHAEDYELWCRLVFKKGVKGANVSEYLFKYRINPDGVSLKNKKVQRETAARIGTSLNIVIEKSLHANVFFLHSKPITKEQMSDLNKVKKMLCSRKMKFSYIAYGTILYHLLKLKQWRSFVKMLICPLGIYTICKIIMNKLVVAFRNVIKKTM